MKTKGRRLLRRLTGVLMGVAAFGVMQLSAAASSTESLHKFNAGAAAVLDADGSESRNEKDLSGKASSSEETDHKSGKDKDASDEDDSEESNLVMAKVQNSVNVREKADEDSEKVGKLYSDCGGEILERQNGWTKLKSGNVTGWVNDKYLVFGKEAKELAEDVGNLIATIHADTLRVRKEPREDAKVFGLVAKDTHVGAVEVLDKDWVSIEYQGEIGYVAAEYVTIDFIIDSGETMEEIRKREAKEREEKRKADEAKAKTKENRGAVQVEAADDVLLGALIQCEAGNQPYEGQLAVGAVVMNRVRSGGYPNSISGVIYASGQFPPALSGAVARRVEAGVRASCMQAAQEAIAGVSNVGGATHFRRDNGRDGILIGNHIFW